MKKSDLKTAPESATLAVITKLSKAISPIPSLAIILGSGFDCILPEIKVEMEISYAKLQGFSQTGVDGHRGSLIHGTLANVPILVLAGRSHYYEGRSMGEITYPIRVLAELGVKDLLLTNAAGGINRKYKPGEFMVTTDHINFMGMNPLRGLSGPKSWFTDLSKVYDEGLRKCLKKAASRSKVKLHEGIYVAVSGPSYETPAEIRAFRMLGADAVGMSTVPEAVVARRCGMNVAALSCVTNAAAGEHPGILSHAEVLVNASNCSQAMIQLLRTFAGNYLDSSSLRPA